ncbi:DUF1835 domain-containing protein [Pseudomonas knackmussii]|uniref:DUF1835 domain-containing protein n=1 Tax=Pseudomonas knackmussii TaxID=65741 RepID=UPI003BD8B318
MLHLVCGDYAAEVLRAAMASGALPPAPVRVMPDDLAVGPLHGVDAPPCLERARFWHQLGADVLTDRAIATELSADAEWLRAPDAERLCLWHGDSASEQLLLRRVCALLPARVELHAVAGGSGECRSGTRRAIAMLAPTELAALPAEHLDSASRDRLGAQWQHWRERDDTLRLWLDGRLQGADYALIDNALLAECSAEWRPARRLIAPVMAGVDGLFVTDLLSLWRLRQLAVEGRLETRGTGPWDDLEARLA